MRMRDLLMKVGEGVSNERRGHRLNGLNVRFCNGPLCQAAPVYPAAGHLLLSVVSLRCHSIRSVEAVSPSFQRSL